MKKEMNKNNQVLKKRNEIAQSAKESKIEEKLGKLKFSSNIKVLKRILNAE